MLLNAKGKKNETSLFKNQVYSKDVNLLYEIMRGATEGGGQEPSSGIRNPSSKSWLCYSSDLPWVIWLRVSKPKFSPL